MDASTRAARPFTRRETLACLAAAPWVLAAQAAPPAVSLASDWPLGRSPRDFLVSEKFDGVRAVWREGRLRFRSGRPIAAPDWFVRALPDHPLDGELWWGHGQFDRVSGVVRQQRPDEAAWRQLRYLVFDAPGQAGGFEARWRALQAVIEAAQRPWLQRVAQQRVDSAAELQRQLQAVVRTGAEGLVLHQADALWRPGRSDALFKLKPEPDDEALVVGHQPGQGRLAGMTGALIVQTPQGQRFALGSGLTDALRREPPPVGSWVTYRYRDRTPKGIPRFATFLRVRPSE